MTTYGGADESGAPVINMRIGDILLKIGRQCVPGWKRFILVRQSGLTRVDRPGDIESWIQPINPRVMGGGIDSVNFIEYLCLTYQRTESMGKACWHEKLFAALSAKLYTAVLTIACRRATQVDDYVKDFSSQDSDQLCLLERRCLKAQAAHSSR